MNRLLDKVAIITGAGQGVGRGIARRFASEGAAVVVAELNEEIGPADGAGDQLRLRCQDPVPGR